MSAYTDIPQSSFLRFLPAWFQPYAQLGRWDRPVGTWLLFWPCAWSVTLAADEINIGLLAYVVLFLIGAFLMRGAGCTLNDMADQDFDAAVERTASRPIPSGKISTKQAAVFLATQCLVALIVVLQFNWFTVILSFGSLGIVAAYPFAKRITYWPQFVLGLAFNWGALVGWSAWTGGLEWPAIVMYLAGIAWTLGYDTAYAHQDKSDDAIVGVKSTALLFGAQTALWIAGFYVVAWALLALAGIIANASWPFFVGLAFGALHMAWQITALDIDEPAQCLVIFKSNVRFGLIVWLGAFGALLF